MVLTAAQIEQLINEVLHGEEIKVYPADQVGKRFIIVNLTGREAIDLLWLLRGDDQFLVIDCPSNKKLLRTLAKLIQEKGFNTFLRRSLMIEVQY